MFVKAHVDVPQSYEGKTVLAVPQSALQTLEDRTTVFVQVEPGVFGRRIVETGHSFEGFTEIYCGREGRRRGRDRGELRGQVGVRQGHAGGAGVMLTRLVDWSLDNRPLVLILSALVVLGGGFALTQLPIDAVPDVTNVQVQVLTKSPALGPAEMEQFVTYPIEAAMNGLPDLVEIRSVSRYGLSAVTVVFQDHVNVYFARQLVNERLGQAREAIPPGFGNPEMGPVSTGLGEVFMFTVEGGGLSAMDRRTLLDWDIAPRLRAVPGVTEVNVWGGLPKQYQVLVDPAKLVAYGLSLKEVFEAVERGSGNSGGGYIERNREQYVIRGEGLVRDMADLRKLVLKAGPEGTPVTVGSIAEVREGSMLRIGAATVDGKGETVVGMTQMLAGENALAVAGRVREAVEELQPSLPKGVRIVPFYDREDLVRRVIRTVETNLAEGGLLVVAVLFAFLGQLPRRSDRGDRHPALDALRVHRHGAVADLRQPDEPRRHRLRTHRRRRRGARRERGPAPGRARRAREERSTAHRRGSTRGRASDRLRCGHHRSRLPADPDPRWHRGKDVQADGVHCRVRAAGLHRFSP